MDRGHQACKHTITTTNTTITTTILYIQIYNLLFSCAFVEVFP